MSPLPSDVLSALSCPASSAGVVRGRQPLRLPRQTHSVRGTSAHHTRAPHAESGFSLTHTDRHDAGRPVARTARRSAQCWCHNQRLQYQCGRERMPGRQPSLSTSVPQRKSDTPGPRGGVLCVTPHHEADLPKANLQHLPYRQQHKAGELCAPPADHSGKSSHALVEP